MLSRGVKGQTEERTWIERVHDGIPKFPKSIRKRAVILREIGLYENAEALPRSLRWRKQSRKSVCRAHDREEHEVDTVFVQEVRNATDVHGVEVRAITVNFVE